MSESVAPAPTQAPSVPQMVDQSAPATIPIANPQRSFNDSIKAIAFKTGVKDAPVVEAPTVKFVRDPVTVDAPGSKDAPIGSAPPVETAPVVPPATDPAAPPAVVEPTSELSIDDGEVTLSSQRNPDGTFKTKLDPNEKVDLVIKTVIDPLTGKPKVYSKSLPELARLAKDGITLQPLNQRLTTELQTLKPEVEYYRTNVTAWKTANETLQTNLDAQMALNRELLSAPDDTVVARRQQYQAEMTPEKQLERERADRAAEKATQAQKEQTAKQAAQAEQRTRIATSFVQSRIAPSLAAAEAAGLSRHTVTGLVTNLTQDLMVNGTIPPANWPEMERRITAPDGPFQTELKAEAARRSTESDTVKAAREAAAAAQRRAQAVVNTDGRLMAPIGRAGSDSAPSLPKPKTVQEVKDRLINRSLPASVGGR